MIIDNTQGWSAMTPLIVTKVDDGFFQRERERERDLQLHDHDRD